MSLDLSKYAAYILPPDELNQESDLVIKPPQSLKIPIVSEDYEPTLDDLKELEILQFLTPWFLRPYMENPSPKSTWFLANYAWERLYIVPDPQGTFSLVQAERDQEGLTVELPYSIYQVVENQVIPWTSSHVFTVKREGILWRFRSIYKSRFTPSGLPPAPPPVPSYVDMQIRWYPPFEPEKYTERAYTLLCPRTLFYQMEWEDSAELKRLGAQTFRVNRNITLYKEGIWSPIEEKWQKIMDDFNVFVTRMLYKYKKVEMRVIGIQYFPYMWNCLAAENYILELASRKSVSNLLLWEERTHEYNQKVQTYSQV